MSKKYQCATCMDVFQYKSLLKEHQERVAKCSISDTMLECPFCPYANKTKHNLSRHLQRCSKNPAVIKQKRQRTQQTVINQTINDNRTINDNSTTINNNTYIQFLTLPLQIGSKDADVSMQEVLAKGCITKLTQHPLSILDGNETSTEVIKDSLEPYVVTRDYQRVLLVARDDKGNLIPIDANRIAKNWCAVTKKPGKAKNVVLSVMNGARKVPSEPSADVDEANLRYINEVFTSYYSQRGYVDIPEHVSNMFSFIERPTPTQMKHISFECSKRRKLERKRKAEASREPTEQSQPFEVHDTDEMDEKE